MIAYFLLYLNLIYYSSDLNKLVVYFRNLIYVYYLHYYNGLKLGENTAINKVCMRDSTIVTKGQKINLFFKNVFLINTVYSASSI